jgi:hypothetical protein
MHLSYTLRMITGIRKLARERMGKTRGHSSLAFPHTQDTGVPRSHSGHQTGSCRNTGRAGAVGVFKQGALRCQIVDVFRFNGLVSVTT